MIRWDWIASHGPLIWEVTAEHLKLTGLSMLFGFLLSLPLALTARRWPRLYAPLLGFTGVLFTIPSLALFVLLLPFTGLTSATAVIGLTIYTLYALVRNNVEGLRSVPASVMDASIAMGYTSKQRLWAVEIPLALPVIFAGLRVATVTTISLVSITALIGQGGYGRLFTDGFVRNFPTPLILGIVLSFMTALIADLLLVAIQRALTPWTRRRRAT